MQLPAKAGTRTPGRASPASPVACINKNDFITAFKRRWEAREQATNENKNVWKNALAGKTNLPT